MRQVLLFFIISTLITGCVTSSGYNDPIKGRVKGLVFTGPARGPITPEMIGSMTDVGANFVALVPEGTLFRQSLKINYDFENQWYGERKQASLEGIDLAKQYNLSVMMKPHLAIGWDMSRWERPELDFEDSLSRLHYVESGRAYVASQVNKSDGVSSWRGDFMVKISEDWTLFESSYESFILDYAKIADSLDVELFCIGTELKRTALERPDFWRKMIHKVREVYHGPITYAANWDSFDKIEFWDELDYIGIDAYFPLSNSEKPSEEELIEGWLTVKPQIERIADKFNKPVIFTEWGYENEHYVGKEPWIMGRPAGADNTSDAEAQAMAYRATFNALWGEEWIKGVFVWRWSPGKASNALINYTPRGKMAESVLKENWKH